MHWFGSKIDSARITWSWHFRSGFEAIYWSRLDRKSISVNRRSVVRRWNAFRMWQRGMSLWNVCDCWTVPFERVRSPSHFSHSPSETLIDVLPNAVISSKQLIFTNIQFHLIRFQYVSSIDGAEGPQTIRSKIRQALISQPPSYVSHVIPWSPNHLSNVHYIIDFYCFSEVRVDHSVPLACNLHFVEIHCRNKTHSDFSHANSLSSGEPKHDWTIIITA